MNGITALKNYHPINHQEVADQEIMLSYIESFDNFLTRENKYGHFTASSWIVNQDFTKILMIYHNIYQSWSWTGGHADGESDFLQVAVKEAKEETGITSITPLSKDIFSLEAICVDGHIKNGIYVSSHVHLNLTYLLQADDTQPLHVKEDEAKGVMWVPIKEAVSYSNEPKMQEIYKKLNEKLAAYLLMMR